MSPLRETDHRKQALQDHLLHKAQMTDLEYYAARWLKWEKDCALVMLERTPRPMAGQPDVFGVTRSRYALEIEIKRSVSDFRANAKKYHIVNRCSTDAETAARFTARAPKQFWFMAPPKIAAKIDGEIPDYAGLLTLTGVQVQVIKKAPTNNASERLSLKECAKLMNCAGNMIIAMMAYRRSEQNQDPHLMDEFYANDLPQYDKQPFDYLNFQI